ncbi:acylphosphatase [Pseudomonas oryzihabitans]|uniref:acylphosphatase n=1 Tax=Pseudomonas rhizoryzae TaxID=2571129 RepID=UPI000737330A|nr:acylphosphatase [Pseudomonas rhizoryzae]KTS78925.1 acylphosphatase [Pseudomonas psychrotolerans]KTT28302.1 acylphosphatase [Pseudomonas psychrotolerans]KTT32987.1 acylphosphatase [Pseudomonas psychrotolerans]KTT36135.1 acylphosphatase [Pseudomonas psychrotolerans]KTT45692.1 acylphosphatase [Pseudomonas psychrotolerans]
MTTLARHALISGRVQGVYYRESTRQEAQRLGVTGWVRNLADGRVECHLEGSAEALARLESWLWQGPATAQVTAVELEEVALEGFTDFQVRRANT